MGKEETNEYTLERVVILSRHNIRSPLSGYGSLLGEITPHKWFEWSSAPSELSLRGGVLETMMGQYFRKELVGEGFFPDNYLPKAGEVRFYANSMQRTVATAQYFSSGFLPLANVKVEHHLAIGNMDPVFNPQLTKTSPKFNALALEQIAKMGGGSLEGLGNKLTESYALLSKVLDIKDSPLYKEGKFTFFKTDDTSLILEKFKEPAMKGSLKTACSAADALVLQYYEERDAIKAAFGQCLTTGDWEKISLIKDWYGDILFTSPAVCVNVAHPLLKEMLSEMEVKGRKFSFLCGHDSNIGSVLAALQAEEYSLPGTIEKKIPIGCKLVIRKYIRTSDGKTFASLNLVYQSTGQLRSMSLLDEKNPPLSFKIKLIGLEENADGLYEYSDLKDRIIQAIDAYDVLPEEENVNVKAAEGIVSRLRPYNLKKGA